MKIRSMAAMSAGGALERYEYEAGPLGAEHVEIAVESCGICHSDLSMLKNEWGLTSYPFVPGHEVSGKVVAVGSAVTSHKVGQRVGLGWYSGSCMTCRQCMGGDQNLCAGAQATMIGRPGGFASRVRSHWAWATPIPDGLDPLAVGPLFCGGITVFNPIVQFGVKPTDRVGVVGIGGLGHMALMFLNKWGCEVTAFTSSESKKAEALKLGAHRAVPTRDDAALSALKGQFDFILVTVNVALNWPLFYNALAPKGRLHVVGAVLEPIPSAAFQMIMSQLSLSASPLGSPVTTMKMLDFCGRHAIKPVTETFPMSKVNEALEHLESGKARYRIVLTNDLG
jgi:alcohol/geraniol dehydrogenase (NADP+)